MGCVFPKPDTVNENLKSNIFKVVNIDQEGNGYLPGKIEVTAEDLLLHQKKKEPISWPLRTLRRYGYENNMFSFEAGRRCPTGEGIFAFRCDQAEQLFRLLQTNIQRYNGGNTDAQQSNYLEPRSSRHESVGSQSSCPATPVSPQLPSINVYNFETRNAECMKESAIVTSNDTSVTSSPLYINVPTNSENDLEVETPQNAYIYLTDKNVDFFSTPLAVSYSNCEFNKGEQSPKDLEYITLELNNGSSIPVAKTPVSEDGGPSPGYTTIDFQKTWALVQSTKPNAENDRGCTRRTRHNSTLYTVQPSYR